MELSFFDYFLGAAIYNWVFLLFGLLAQNRASKLKSYWWPLVVGLLLNSTPYLGFLAGLSRNPELYGASVESTTVYLIYLAIFLVFFIFICSRVYKKAAAKAEAEKQEQDSGV